MPSKSKAKGNRFERECVNAALEHGLESKRAWGSDGRSLGLHAEVDMVIEEFTVQCKVRKRIAKWITPSEEIGGLHLQLVKESRGKSYVIIEMTMFLSLLSLIKKATGSMKIFQELKSQT
jgi:Holliday junction resolvase|tara:strand:- start:5 stop:364 length:360 start_codon:yes stop_codon:yes gene_type:complete